MAFDPVGSPVVEKVQQVETEETEEELKRKDEAQLYADKRLKELVSSDEMYNAMELFLLGDPERQIEQLGDVDSLLKNGDVAKAQSENVKARYSYETAAKIEMYRRNKESLRKFLVLASEVTEENDKNYRFQKTLLDNLDEALRVSKEYYNIAPKDEPLTSQPAK